MCSESTARDAMMLDYKVVMVTDANAARYDDDHLAGLTSFYQSFGDVRSTDDCINILLKDGDESFTGDRLCLLVSYLGPTFTMEIRSQRPMY